MKCGDAMTNILFIGGAGFIGSNLIRALDKEKYRITVIEPKEAYCDRLDGQDVTLMFGSLDNVDFIKECIEQREINIVVHLVSTLIPGSTYEEYKREYKYVIFPSIELMEFCNFKFSDNEKNLELVGLYSPKLLSE